MINIRKAVTGQRGYTLTELMTVFGLTTVIATSMFAVARTGQQQSNVAELRMTIQDNAREGMYKMVQELRKSAPEKVTINNNGSSVEFYVADSSDPITDTYEINWDGAHLIEYEIGGTNNNQLIRTNQTTGETTVLANYISSLSFSLSSADNVVSINMGVQKTTENNRTISLQLNSKAELRNADGSGSDDEGAGSDDDEDEDDGSDHGDDDGSDHEDDGSDHDDDHGSDH